MKYSEKWGDSIDSAVELALLDLKLSRDQVNVTVLEEPSKGFFGIGTRLAKVRVEEIVKEKQNNISEKNSVNTDKPKNKKKETIPEKPAQDKAQDKAAEKKEKKSDRKKEKSVKNKESKPETAAVKPADSQEKAPEIKNELPEVSNKPDNLVPAENHPAKEFLEKTFADMKLNVSVSVSTNETSVYVDIDGADTGSVIGKRGQTLDALQYLTSLVVNKGEDEYIRVVVDAEGYRAKREETLKKLALRLAEKVKKTHKSVRLEPMNPYERKVIHTTLQKFDGIYTVSEGDEPHRKVVIKAAKK